MVDFTSALYLGPQPLSRPFPPHLSVTTGKPAALGESGLHRAVAQDVARRQGLERGLLAPSTLHVFQDIFTGLNRSNVLLIDEALYAVGRWGAMRAMGQGVPVTSFSATDTGPLTRLMHTQRLQHRTPWIVTDGWNLDRGCPAPLAQYLTLLRPWREAVLLVDDTQAFGVVGREPSVDWPYGTDGGGCLPYLGLCSPKILTLTSLAKGLGVPVAVLAGSTERLERYQRLSDVRVHTSPVSNLHAWAAAQTLETDRLRGNALRQQLYGNVRLFRQLLRPVGTGGGWFPVQKLRLPDVASAVGLYHRLKAQGIRSLLLSSRAYPTVPEVAFCLRADHTVDAIRHTCHHILTFIGHSAPVLSTSRSLPDYEPLTEF